MRKIKQKQNEYRALGEPSFKAFFLPAIFIAIQLGKVLYFME